MSSQESKFLSDAQRARECIRKYPTINAKELAEALGLHSEGYAHTVKNSVNAHQSEEKGDDTCSLVFQPDGAGTIGFCSRSR
jgi:hypothetical protein